MQRADLWADRSEDSCHFTVMPGSRLPLRARFYIGPASHGTVPLHDSLVRLDGHAGPEHITESGQPADGSLAERSEEASGCAVTRAQSGFDSAKGSPSTVQSGSAKL